MLQALLNKNNFKHFKLNELTNLLKVSITANIRYDSKKPLFLFVHT